MSWPSTSTVPELGVTLPQMMLSRVVLPAPLGPISAKISPSWISWAIPLSACKPDSYVLIRWEIAMMGGMAESLPSSRGTMNSPVRDDEVINIGDSVAVAESSGDRVVRVPPTLGTIQAMTIVEDCWQQPIFIVGHVFFVFCRVVVRFFARVRLWC